MHGPFFQSEGGELRVKGIYAMRLIKQREFYAEEMKCKYDYKGL